MPMPWRMSVDYERESFVFRLPDGLPVYTHFSFLFLAMLVTAPLWLEGRLASVVIAVALMAILYLSILAHELGHITAARRQRARGKSIEIGLYGGLAHFEWDYHRGIALRPIALAGPAVNLGLAGLFFTLYWLTWHDAAEAPRHFAPFETPGIVQRTLFLASFFNFWFALVNLLPAFPLDGGTIAQDLLCGRLGHRRATLIVGICGLVLASVGAVVAVVTVMMGMPVLIPASVAANRTAVEENLRK